MAETGVEMMMEVKEKGPIAMYDMMADKTDSIKNEFIEGAKEWAITNMIKQGLIRLATMINPAGAIVQAVLGIYNGVIFLVNNWDRILAFVNSVFDSIAAIASGAISQASAFVEKTMAQTIPLILDFIAQQLNLSGIAERITKIIHRIRKPIDQVIDKVIDFITNKVKKIAGKLLGKDKDKAKDKEKHKEKAEDTKKDFEKDKGDDKTTDVDRKEHERFANEIATRLSGKTKSKDLQGAYNEKLSLAKSLETEYGARLKSGLKVTINFETFDKVQSDSNIKFKITIAPNTTNKDGEIALFKGNHVQLEGGFENLETFEGQTVFASKKNGDPMKVHLFTNHGSTGDLEKRLREEVVQAAEDLRLNRIKNLTENLEKEKNRLIKLNKGKTPDPTKEAEINLNISNIEGLLVDLKGRFVNIAGDYDLLRQFLNDPAAGSGGKDIMQKITVSKFKDNSKFKEVMSTALKTEATKIDTELGADTVPLGQRCVIEVNIDKIGTFVEGLTLGPGATYINATKTFTKIVMVLRKSSIDPPLFRIETAYPN
jgi:hypothetical protein